MRNPIEIGSIFFLYTSRSDRVRGPADVHEFAFILSPDRKGPRRRLPPSPDGSRLRRILIVRNKAFPAPVPPDTDGQQAIAEVVDVRRQPEELVQVLEARVASVTDTPVGTLAARPCGEGRYTMSIHNGHTHLAYALELPKTPGPVQCHLGLTKEAVYRVAIREARAIEQAGRAIGGEGFMPFVETGALDVPGCELLMSTPGWDRGALKTYWEPERPGSAEIFGELKLSRDRHPLTPLYEGLWS